MATITSDDAFCGDHNRVPPARRSFHSPHISITTPHHLPMHFVETIIAYLRHASDRGVLLPRVGNIFDVTNPGLTIIAYLQHAARSTRPTDASVATSSTATSTARSTRHNAGERQRCHPLPPWRAERAVPLPHRRGSYCRKGRAERAVPRRGTIVVSPTQLVPEVLAVWGCD